MHQGGLGNTRTGRETSLSWEGRLFRESRLGRELNRDISLSWEGCPCRESRLGRESRLSRETSLWWEQTCKKSRYD